MKITFNDLAGMGYASVTDYCRYLKEHWKPYCNYSLEDKVEVYRGDMLCLTVSSVKYGASVEPDVGNARWRLYVPQEPV